MKQEFVEKMFKSIFPDVKIEIISYEVLEKNQLNENNEWVKDSPAIFIQIRYNNDGETIPNNFNLTEYLTNLTGHEFSITKFNYPI